MAVATPSSEVGIRELKNSLSKYLDLVRAGGEVVVTDRGHPIARLSGIDQPTDRLAELVASGVVRAPVGPDRRHRAPRIKTKGSVSDLVAQQRR